MSEGDHENDLDDVRFKYPREGVVVRRDDPLELGRITFRIPGMIEPESDWTLPFGNAGGGGPQRGMKFVPPVGAEVIVIFIGGDPDRPRFTPGHWGLGEMPSDAVDAAGNHPEDVHVIETVRWSMVFDDRTGRERLAIRDKRTGDFFEMDGVAPGMQVKASAGFLFTIDGVFSVDASAVILNGRKLNDGPQNF